MTKKEFIDKFKDTPDDAELVLTYTACDPHYGCERLTIGDKLYEEAIPTYYPEDNIIEVEFFEFV